MVKVFILDILKLGWMSVLRVMLMERLEGYGLVFFIGY